MHWFLQVFCLLLLLLHFLLTRVYHLLPSLLAYQYFQIFENKLYLSTNVCFFRVDNAVDYQTSNKIENSYHKLILVLLLFVSFGLYAEEFYNFGKSLDDFCFEFQRRKVNFTQDEGATQVKDIFFFGFLFQLIDQ